MKTNNWFSLYQSAQRIEERLPEKRKEVYEKCIEKFPKIKYKNFTGLLTGIRHNKLEKKIVDFLADDIERIEVMKKEAKDHRKRSEELLAEIHDNTGKNKLNPNVDVIPVGEYRKLDDCKVYSLRKSCNHGSDDESFWDRCEHMTYDNSKSISDSKRWLCNYK